MAERKKTPNILADLLGDTTPVPSPKEGNAVKHQGDLPVKLQAGKPLNQQAVDEVNATSAAESEEENDAGLATKVKVTFYLSQESVDLLDDAQRLLRRIGRGTGKIHSKAATSKSALLEEALKLACADLESRGKESQLAHMLF